LGEIELAQDRIRNFVNRTHSVDLADNVRIAEMGEEGGSRTLN
ncbi:hypothetical protein LCGC14_2854120, partial [marine sediment metagenome]